MSKAREIVLKLVADGKISVEEAEELLDAIEGGAEEPFAGFFKGKRPERRAERGTGHREARQEHAEARQAHAEARQEQAEARRQARQAQGEAGRARRGSRGGGFDFDFNFPWDQEGWQWPWEQEGWQWPWQQADMSGGDEAQVPAVEIETPEGTQLKINVDGGDLVIQGNGEAGSMRVIVPDAASKVTNQDGVVQVLSSGEDVVVEAPGNVVSLEIAQNGGDLVVGKLEASIAAKVAGGDMVVSEVSGKIQASVEGGDARFTGITSTEVEVRANGGDAHLSMLSPVNEGSITLSSSEDISLVLPSDAQCDISATAGDDISHSLPQETLEVIEQNDNYLSAKLNGGGAEIILSASSGDVNIGT